VDNHPKPIIRVANHPLKVEGWLDHPLDMRQWGSLLGVPSHPSNLFWFFLSSFECRCGLIQSVHSKWMAWIEGIVGP
jgi:hypothetical protein